MKIKMKKKNNNNKMKQIFKKIKNSQINFAAIYNKKDFNRNLIKEIVILIKKKILITQQHFFMTAMIK